MRKVKVYLKPKSKMTDKKGRQWLGMNPEAAKPNKFRKIKHIEVSKAQSKKLQARTARHEYIEEQLMKHGKTYKQAHKVALKKDKKPVKGVKFKMVKKK
jgi:hypothetical protein